MQKLPDEKTQNRPISCRNGRSCVFSKGRQLALPVAGAIVLGVGAGGVLHDDGITGAEVVEEPPCVGGADVDAAVTDVALTLVMHRPWSAVYEVTAAVEPDA